MTVKVSLGDRMKGYENVFRQNLPNGFPIIIRIDGRAFHTLTKGITKPSSYLEDVMDFVGEGLVKEIPYAKFAYIQSDEISILIRADEDIYAEPWFANNVQKMASVSASVATFLFLKGLKQVSTRRFSDFSDERNQRKEDWEKIINRPVSFDSRVFIVPKNEIENYFIWRQRDMIRNAISMHAQRLFKPKELDGKRGHDMIKMMRDAGFDFEAQPIHIRRGRAMIVRSEKWVLDQEMPILSEERDYLYPKGETIKWES